MSKINYIFLRTLSIIMILFLGIYCYIYMLYAIAITIPLGMVGEFISFRLGVMFIILGFPIFVVLISAIVDLYIKQIYNNKILNTKSENKQNEE